MIMMYFGKREMDNVEIGNKLLAGIVDGLYAPSTRRHCACWIGAIVFMIPHNAFCFPSFCLFLLLLSHTHTLSLVRNGVGKKRFPLSAQDLEKL